MRQGSVGLRGKALEPCERRWISIPFAPFRGSAGSPQIPRLTPWATIFRPPSFEEDPEVPFRLYEREWWTDLSRSGLFREYPGTELRPWKWWRFSVRGSSLTFAAVCRAEPTRRSAVPGAAL
jgi:hypothetical protein